MYLYKNEENYLPFFVFPGLSQFKEILHFITTRQGGYSEMPFDTFNLAFHVGDKEENVFKNRAKLAQSFSISLQNFTESNQVHGTGIAIINQEERRNRAIDGLTTIKSSDAMITDQKNICLLIFVADCVPVLLYDRRKKIIALVHAGWKGTVSLITQKTIQRMQSHWSCSSEDIFCAIGPSIGPCCYQVGSEVIKKFRAVFPKEQNIINLVSSDGKGYLDLWETNRWQLLYSQVPEKNIEVARLCTFCHSEIFFSSRKDNGYTGRFAAGIMLRK